SSSARPSTTRPWRRRWASTPKRCSATSSAGTTPGSRRPAKPAPSARARPAPEHARHTAVGIPSRAGGRQGARASYHAHEMATRRARGRSPIARFALAGALALVVLFAGPGLESVAGPAYAASPGHRAAITARDAKAAIVAATTGRSRGSAWFASLLG